MYEFIGTLVEFVLPRLREFPRDHHASCASSSRPLPVAVSGVVSFGLPPEAMGLFPQIEINMDMYPKLSGMHIHFHNQRRGSWCAKPCSGFGLRIPDPFVEEVIWD